jgi:transposase
VLSVAPAPAIFLHTDATDMRKSFTGLCGLIRGVFGDDPADGSLFLFVNKRRDRIKALWWDGDGFVLWYKRLEQGTFEVVSARNGAKRVRIDSTQLAMILGGVRLESVRRRKRFSRAS